MLEYQDAYAYGRALLDQLFTKEEQKQSIVLKSKKSVKPPLSPKRVEKMFGKYIYTSSNDYYYKDLLIFTIL